MKLYFNYFINIIPIIMMKYELILIMIFFKKLHIKYLKFINYYQSIICNN